MVFHASAIAAFVRLKAGAPATTPSKLGITLGSHQAFASAIRTSLKVGVPNRLTIKLHNDLTGYIRDELGGTIVIVDTGFGIRAKGAVRCNRVLVLMTAIRRNYGVSKMHGGFAVRCSSGSLQTQCRVKNSIQSTSALKQKSAFPHLRHTNLEFVAILLHTRALMMIYFAMDNTVRGKGFQQEGISAGPEDHKILQRKLAVQQ